jgi:cytochrome b
MAEPAKTSSGMRQVQVWDFAVRVFHWLLVALIAFMWWSGRQKGDWMSYHFYAGYAILTLIVFRIIWGFVGGTHARFADFIYGPSAIIVYLKTLPSRTAAKFAGHNPVGGWSVVLMILCVGVQVGTGLFASNDDTGFEGPLVKLVSGAMSGTLTSIHRISINVLLAVIAVHISAVVYYLVYKKENLIAPMISGKKHLPETLAAAERRIGGSGRALVVLAMVIVGVFFLVR